MNGISITSKKKENATNGKECHFSKNRAISKDKKKLTARRCLRLRVRYRFSVAYRSRGSKAP